MKLTDFKEYYLDKSFRSDWNNIKIGKNEGTNHAIIKIKVCTNLIKKGLPFLTECKLVPPYGRVDVISPLSNEIFECMSTEPDSVFVKKKHPREFIVRKARLGYGGGLKLDKIQKRSLVEKK